MNFLAYTERSRVGWGQLRFIFTVKICGFLWGNEDKYKGRQTEELLFVDRGSNLELP
jgi:hypothetical protein